MTSTSILRAAALCGLLAACAPGYEQVYDSWCPIEGEQAGPCHAAAISRHEHGDKIPELADYGLVLVPSTSSRYIVRQGCCRTGNAKLDSMVNPSPSLIVTPY